MTQKAFVILNDFVNLCLCLTYYFTLKKKNKSMPTIKYIKVYLLITLIFCCINELCFYKVLNTNRLIFMLAFAFAHQFLLIKFIISELLNHKLIRFNKLFFLLLTIFELFICYYDFIFGSYYSASFANVSILYYTSFYFIVFFNEEFSDKIQTGFAFYIITGIFISSCLITPIILFGKYFYEFLDRDYYYLISIIAPISSLLFYVFILKANSCIGRVHK